VRRIHNKKTKNPSLKGKQYDGKVSYICKKNISATLIVFFFNDGRTINWQQRGTIKTTTFSFQK
jgi:hypothetical protein